ncbi:hypothetical protein O3M35_005396 [Rhynocoris fuscipes]|uniref:Uncharacterized protein n=1 Tax=Rhynocoris fuscipes TaxID=488301 RepID=A0AAW1DKA0_9HEMI
MAYNGDSGMAKRQRTDLDGASQRKLLNFSICAKFSKGKNNMMTEGITRIRTLWQDHTDSYNKNFEPRRKRPESEPNNVLLFTIINPVYPITVVSGLSTSIQRKKRKST